MENNKEKKKTHFNYNEEFLADVSDISEEQLKSIFNKKYFNYIKRKEKRKLGGDNVEKISL